jgi:hypothetical protein
MRTFGKRYTTKEWARLAMKLGLIATDAKVWSGVNRQLRQGANDVNDVIRRKFGETTDRLNSARVEIRSHSDWLARVTSLLAGVGIGMGVGMLLAPTSGDDMRAALRDKVSDVKNNVGDIAARATRSTRSSSDYRSSGAVGD